MSQSLNIGVLAYTATPGTVFVRVPNERGRWMLVDRCVIEVDCPLCKAITGEPCRSNRALNRGEVVAASEIRYHVAHHVARRYACSDKLGTRHVRHYATAKLRLRLDDLRAAGASIEDN